MKQILYYIVIGVMGLDLALVGGCRQADRGLMPAPTRAELPSVPEIEKSLPIDVGVEGAAKRPQVFLVPTFEEIELTPEEREALGKEELPIPDVLAFHRPAPGPEQGVCTESDAALVGVGRPGGASSGQSPVYQASGVQGVGGFYFSVHGFPRTSAGAAFARVPGGEVGTPWRLLVGEGLPREPAQAAPRVAY
jgi:hypothetical protein